MHSSLVIIPTYNERLNIEDLIQRIFALEIPFDVLVVDDDSPDGTSELVQRLQKQFAQLNLITRKNKSGIGTAYITGFRYALEKGYDYIFEMDADFSHNPGDLVRLYLTCTEEDYDFVHWIQIHNRSKCSKLANWQGASVVSCQYLCSVRYWIADTRYHCRIQVL